jgi:hypothetical protein
MTHFSAKKILLFREVSRSAQTEMLKAMFAFTYKDKTLKQVCTGGYNTKITLPIIFLT